MPSEQEWSVIEGRLNRQVIEGAAGRSNPESRAEVAAVGTSGGGAFRRP